MGRWLNQQQTTVPKTKWQALQQALTPENKFMTGAWYQKVFDPLMSGQYAVAGLGRQALEMDDAGAIEGIKNRVSWVDIAQEKFPYEPSEDWKKNFWQELKRVAPGVLGDIILDPLWLLPPVKIAKMLGITKIAKVVSKTKPMAWIGEKLGQALVTRYGQPGDYVYLAQKTARNIAMREERALAIGKPITGLTNAEQQRVAQLIKGGISVSEIEKPLREVTEPAVKEYQRLGKRAVDLGLLDEETFYDNFGRYMPRLYRTKEMPEGAIRFFGDRKPIRVNLDRFRKRQDIPEDIRMAMGEIKQAGYPTTKGLTQLGQAVERARFFKEVSQRYAKTEPFKNWQQLPTTKALGELGGKYVSPVIYGDIQQMIRVASKGERAYRTGIGLWKWAKVIANPATHLRNMYSNVILADLGGLSPLRVDIWAEALSDLAHRGRYYKELKKNSNILYETFYGREIGDMLKALEKSDGTNMFMKMRNTMKFITQKTGNVYQAEEQWSKMALYIFYRKKGWEALKAAKEAEKWLFNYREVPYFIDVLRGSRIGGGLGALASGAYPFITFSYKVTPRLIEKAWKNTPQLTKWMKMYRGIEQFADEETLEKQKELLPDYMREGMYLRLPFQDEAGREQYLDLNFILPWGDIGEVGRTIEPNHPFWAMLYSLILNKSGLGYDIVKPGSTEQEAREAITDYIYKAMMPSLSPEIPGVTRGGYSYDRLASAFRGEMDYMEKARSVKSAIWSSIAGIKTIPIDIEEAKERKESETDRKIRDVQSRIRNLYRLEKRKIIDHDEFLKKEVEYQKKIKELGGKTYTPSDRWLKDNNLKATQPVGRWIRQQIKD